MTKEVTIKKADLRQYSIEKPAEMVLMAGVLKSHIVKHNLYTNISNKNYVHVEGWQVAGFLMGIYPVVESVEDLSSGTETKWRATVGIYRGEKLVGKGIAVCSNKENKKKSFDEYAILSMAQTRAIGKAYRNLIGWVMKLAGYESTPTEEMKKMGEVIEATPVVSVQKTTAPAAKVIPRCQKCAKPVDEAVAIYSQRRFGKILCREDQPKKK